jgi:flagellar secretion chaperone FliS
MAMQALKAYGSAALENQVDAADPHKLIDMLYDGAVQAVGRAQMHIERGEVGPKCEAISRAMAIVDQGLAASVNEESGGELAKNLLLLYGYIVHRLALANARSDTALLGEVETLLKDLRSAWAAIRGSGEGA